MSIGSYVIPIIITVAISYIIGSVNFSIIVTNFIMSKEDIRTMGSGNAGFTNVLRSVGKLPAIATAIGDFSKGILAVFIGYAIFSSNMFFDTTSFEQIKLGGYIAGISCFIGHIYPCFFKFKGGKGVLTASAMVLMIDYRVYILVMAVFFIVLMCSKIVSLSSILAVMSYPIFNFLILYFIEYKKNIISFNYIIMTFLLSSVIALFIVYMHKANIKRLLLGTEKRITVKKK